MISNCIPVSAIVPCYRCKRTIERAIESIATQVSPPSEVILVEDCSSDGTLEVIQQTATKYPDDWIKVITLSRNVGPGKARNIGWESATQPYIAFLDADDMWHRDKLNIQYKWMKDNPDVVLTGHGIVPISRLPESPVLIRDCDASRVSPYLFLIKNKFSTPSAMLQRLVPFRFQDEKRYSEDYLLWLTIALNRYPVWYLELPLACYGKALYGDSGQTKSLWKMEMGEMDTYIRLYKKGCIPFVTLFGLSLLSIAKLFRRTVLLHVRP